MKVAVIGSRNIKINNIWEYLPDGITEIVSGSARGVDMLAREYAINNRIKLTEFLPEYEKYARVAPLKRNDKIIDYADEVIALWDGKSRGTNYVINRCRRIGKRIYVYIIK